MKDQKSVIIESALDISEKTESNCIFLFLNTTRICRWFLKSGMYKDDNVIIVIPHTLGIRDIELKKAGVTAIRSWSGNQTRFSQIKYAFFHGVMQGLIKPDSRVVCVLGPWGKGHLDTVTVHDLALSWSEEFPFDPRLLISKRALNAVMAVVDIALDIGALGREGKSIGTTFIIGDTEEVLKSSHQAVFNPFKGYPKKERIITRSEVVESIKEFAQLDGAIIISDTGVIEAAGRHLDAAGAVTRQLRGLGSRHRAAAGMTRKTEAVAVVVSESTGRVTIFDNGRIISSLEPVISRRIV
ncbi:MAG: diadenylate cyclase [Nitrospiraceae bacterium]|nr:MAG: diadenylate cyclase [Nitrospiraceae bacterium]